MATKLQSFSSSNSNKFIKFKSLAATGLSLIFDVLFAIIEIPAWTAYDEGNQVWQTLRGMHNFGIFCYVLILILKLGLAFFLFKKTRAQNTQ
jgi:hypothetical protein